MVCWSDESLGSTIFVLTCPVADFDAARLALAATGRVTVSTPFLGGGSAWRRCPDRGPGDAGNCR